MDKQVALDLIDQAADLGVFGEVAVTGGEPFAFYDDLVELSQRMALRSLPMHVITACAWATEDTDPAGVLGPLVANGLASLTVSHDPSHERWVSRDQVRRVVDAAVHLGLRVKIYGTFWDESSNLEQLFPEYTEAEEVALEGRLVGPQVGRRRKAAAQPSQASHPNLQRADTCYRRVYHEVTVFWDGEVYPCCSVYNRETPGISYGNVFADSLGEIWNRIEGSTFLRMIKRRGYFELFAELEARAPDVWRSLPQPLAASGACHLCHLVMSDTERSAQIRAVFDTERSSP